MNLLDRFTNYRSRYHYPPKEAFIVELFWRLEHIPSARDGAYDKDDGWLRGTIRSFAYRNRKEWERRGFAKRTGPPGR